MPIVRGIEVDLSRGRDKHQKSIKWRSKAIQIFDGGCWSEENGLDRVKISQVVFMVSQA